MRLLVYESNLLSSRCPSGELDRYFSDYGLPSSPMWHFTSNSYRDLPGLRVALSGVSLSATRTWGVVRRRLPPTPRGPPRIPGSFDAFWNNKPWNAKQVHFRGALPGACFFTKAVAQPRIWAPIALDFG